MRKRFTNSLTGIVCCFFLLMTACGGGGGGGSVPAAAPTVTTLPATSVGATTATLNGNVTANGLATNAWFEYGEEPTLVSFTKTSFQSVGSGTTSQSVNAALTGLATGTTYYFRVAASNASGETKGSINILSSSTPPLPPAINVSSDNVSFGNVVLGVSSDHGITVGNTGGSDLVIGQIAPPANPLASPFSIVNDLCSGKALKASQTCTFQVRFSPTVLGNGLNDTFDIPSNDPDNNPVTVSLSGNAKALRVSINQVNTDNCPNLDLLIDVSDKNGNPINGLGTGNFELSENGVPIDSFNLSQLMSQNPYTIALVLDVSGSLSGFLPDVKAASKNFITLLKPGDAASIITFAADVRLEQSFTTDNNALISAIDNISLRTEFGTLLYDALRVAIDNVVTQINNRAIILISDGIDTGTGSNTLNDLINYAKETQVTIFTIGIGDVDNDVMGQLAKETGGQFFVAPDTSQLDSIYQTIRDIIDGQYTIHYISSSTANVPILLNLVVDTNDGSGWQGEVSRQFQGCP